MGAKDAARCVNVAEAATFSPDARVNQELMATGSLVTRINSELSRLYRFGFDI